MLITINCGAFDTDLKLQCNNLCNGILEHKILQAFQTYVKLKTSL